MTPQLTGLAQSKAPRRVLAWIIVVALGLTSCGGGGDDDQGSGGGLNRSSPVAVAKAFAESRYRCGERGAGLRAQLVYPPAEAEEHRKEAAEEAAPGGCQEKPVPDILAVQVPGEGKFPILVEVSNSVDCTKPSKIPLIQIEGRWFVDQREFNPDLLCFRFGRG